MIKTFQLSTQALEQLSRLKRNTGISTNNVLCRWAFCLSLSEKSRPPQQSFEYDGSGRGEISWETFSGEYGSVYLALLKQRCFEDGCGVSSNELKNQLLLHIHRGLGYLLGNKSASSIEALVEGALERCEEQMVE